MSFVSFFLTCSSYLPSVTLRDSTILVISTYISYYSQVTIILITVITVLFTIKAIVHHKHINNYNKNESNNNKKSVTTQQILFVTRTASRNLDHRCPQASVVSQARPFTRSLR